MTVPYQPTPADVAVADQRIAVIRHATDLLLTNAELPDTDDRAATTIHLAHEEIAPAVVAATLATGCDVDSTSVAIALAAELLRRLLTERTS